MASNKENFTLIEREKIKFNTEYGHESLLKYCTESCEDRCGAEFDPEFAQCDYVCPIARLYPAMVRLAELEHPELLALNEA